MEKRENKSTGCYGFQCHNESGQIYWKQCNKTNEVCENDQCVIMKEEVTYSVENEVEGINATDLNMTVIQIAISNLTDIDEDIIRIRVDIDEIMKLFVLLSY